MHGIGAHSKYEHNTRPLSFAHIHIDIHIDIQSAHTYPGIAVLSLVVGVGGVAGQLVGVHAAVAVDYAGLVILQKPP